MPLRHRHADQRGDDRPRAHGGGGGREVGADSLAYLSLEGVYEAVGTGREVHCDACFTGDYPLEGEHEAQRQARAGRACRRPSLVADPRRDFPIAVLVSGSGTNLQAILDTVHGRDGIEVDVGRQQPRRRRGARAGRARPASRPRCSRPPTTRTARSATRDGRLARRSAGSSWWCWPGYMQLLDRRVPGRVPERRDQRPSGPAASLPRSPTRSGTRSPMESRSAA